LIGKYDDLLRQQYGFDADETQPLWKRVERRIGEMNVDKWCVRPRNMAYHNLLQPNSMPPGTTKLLVLGLNYCIKSTTTKETTTKTFERLADDVRRIYALRDVENDENSYIPSLYIKSEYKFDPAPVLIENALVSFEKAVQQKQQQLQHRRSKPTMNLTHGSWNLIQHFRQKDNYIVIDGDKNLGPCILDRSVYIQRGCKEHIENESNYIALTKERALNC